MKKLVLSIAAICAAVSLNAQTIGNSSFETWAAGEAASWDSYNFFSGAATLTPTPVVQGTVGASDGSSFATVTTFTVSGSTQPTLLPDGVYGSVMSQEIPTTARPATLDFDYMTTIGANDSAIVFVEATKWNGTSRDILGQGVSFYSGNVAAWTAGSVDVIYFDPANPDTVTIYIASSGKGIFNTFGGTTLPVAVAGSRIDVDKMSFFTPTSAPNVTNVVASDISDNGNGTDLQVSFTVPADETDVASYYALAFESGEEYGIGLLATPLAFVQGAGIAIATTGANQTIAFTALDEAYRVGTTSLESDLIVEDVAYKVVIYVEGQNGAVDVYSVSNEITLTSGTSSVAEITLASSVFPNPATEVLNINTNTEATSVSVIAMDGKVVSTQEMNGTSAIVNVADLKSGAYFYEVKSADGSVSRNTFMKK